MKQPSPDALRNRAAWDAYSASYQREHAPQLNTKPCAWGVWALPEDDLRILGDVAGKDVLELGCGAAQWSLYLAQRGARPVGLDNSAAQLEAARALLAERGLGFPLVHASAEAIPLPDASFDVVFCDHGAMSFADPALALPEVARVLRPGGLFAFNAATPWIYACVDAATDALTRELRESYFDLYRYAPPDGMVEFCPTYGQWLRLFREHGFAVEDLVELRPPPDAQTTYASYAPLEWARRWPAEQIWKVRRV